jgi:hypothetical protein
LEVELVTIWGGRTGTGTVLRRVEVYIRMRGEGGTRRRIVEGAVLEMVERVEV